MNTYHETSFIVYPDDCNYMEYDGRPMVHGGTMLLKMDRAAAECVRRFLYDSECNSSRTVGVTNVSFSAGAKLGDFIIIKCRIVRVGVKRIEVSVQCYKEDKYSISLMSSGTFSFCSFLNDSPHPHGITLEN